LWIAPHAWTTDTSRAPADPLPEAPATTAEAQEPAADAKDVNISKIQDGAGKSFSALLEHSFIFLSDR
jgi:hypothetical protein